MPRARQQSLDVQSGNGIATFVDNTPGNARPATEGNVSGRHTLAVVERDPFAVRVTVQRERRRPESLLVGLNLENAGWQIRECKPAVAVGLLRPDVSAQLDD